MNPRMKDMNMSLVKGCIERSVQKDEKPRTQICWPTNPGATTHIKISYLLKIYFGNPILYVSHPPKSRYIPKFKDENVISDWYFEFLVVQFVVKKCLYFSENLLFPLEQSSVFARLGFEWTHLPTWRGQINKRLKGKHTNSELNTNTQQSTKMYCTSTLL